LTQINATIAAIALDRAIETWLESDLERRS